MRKRKATDYRGIAQEIARDSIVTHALSRLIEQIVSEVCAAKQEEINALRRERDEAREALEWAKEATQPIASLVAMTAEGFPDHDICPIRLGQARAIAEAHAAIDAALKEDGE
jgi:hypothetical protein